MIIRTLRTMRRSLSVFKCVRQPNFVSQHMFNHVRPQWQSIYSTQRLFCNKAHSRNGSSNSGDGVQVPPQDTIDSGLDPTRGGNGSPIRGLDTLGVGSDQNRASGQLLGEDNQTGKSDDNVGDAAKNGVSSVSSSSVFAHLLSQGHHGIVQFQNWYDSREKSERWKRGEFFALGSLLCTFYFGYVQKLLNKGRVSDAQAEQILKTNTLCAFSDSKPFPPKGFYIVDRLKTPAGKKVLSYLQESEPGVFLLYGSKYIGKSLMVECTYDKILNTDATTPLIHVSFENGSAQFYTAVNAFPPETQRYKQPPSHKAEKFEAAYTMLGNQLQNNRGYFKKNNKTRVPVLIIDSITDMSDESFDSFASFLKKIVDARVLKVVILASNGASRERVLKHKQLTGRIFGKYEIFNNFSIKEIEDVLKHDRIYAHVDKYNHELFLLIAEAMYNVSGGRIGYVQRLCVKTGDDTSPVQRIKAVTEKQQRDEKSNTEILAALEEEMVEILFDEDYLDKIVTAFGDLKREGFAIDELISPDLPTKINGWRAVEILEHHNIIETLHGPITFESEPLKRIFGNQKLLQKIRDRIIDKQY